MTVASVSDLVDALRTNSLLSTQQLAAIEEIHASWSDPKSFARELIQRGWITQLQANLVLKGKARDLIIGSYVLLDPLGKGGIGRVYKARHLQLDRIVALKFLRKELLSNAHAVQRFQQEARAAARLAHPNIVTLYELATARGQTFLILEYVDGVDLANLIEQRGQLPIAHACHYIMQAATGLQHAHERGLVHRDLKPHNLLLSRADSVVKILDMGLARLVIDEAQTQPSGLTRDGAFMGTPDYIAPEQAMDARRSDIRADIYSLGCTLYYLLAGHPPFPEGTAMQKVVWHQQAEPPALSTLRRYIPPGLEEVIRRLMAKKPEDRPKTPAEAAALLLPFCGSISDLQIPAAPPPVAILVDQSGALSGTVAEGQSGESVPEVIPLADVPATGKRFFTRRKLFVGVALVSLLAGAIAGFFLLRPRHGPNDDPQSLFIEQDVKVGEVFALKGHEGAVQALACSPNGRQALSGDGKGFVRHWNLEKGEFIRGMQCSDSAITSLRFSPDMTQVLVGGADGKVRLWDLQKGQELRRLEGHTGAILVADFLPEENVVVSVSADRTIRTWDLRNTRKKNEWTVNLTEVIAADILPVLKRVLLMGELVQEDSRTGQLVTFNLTTGTEEKHWNHGKQAAIRLSPDGKHALIGSGGTTAGSVRYVGLERGRVIQTYDGRDGHKGNVTALAFSPDGKFALSGSIDRTVKYWGLPFDDKPLTEPVALLHTFEGHESAIRCVQITPSGRRALSGGADNVVRVWALPGPQGDR
jgi:serine/threonine-protein kinase